MWRKKKLLRLSNIQSNQLLDVGRTSWILNATWCVRFFFVFFKRSLGLHQRERESFTLLCKRKWILYVYKSDFEGTFAKKILSKAVKIPIIIYSSLLLCYGHYERTDSNTAVIQQILYSFFLLPSLHPISILRARNCFFFLFLLGSRVWIVWFIVLFNDVWCVAWTWTL